MLDGAVLEPLSDFQVARVKLKRCRIRFGITLCLSCEGTRSKSAVLVEGMLAEGSDI